MNGTGALGLARSAFHFFRNQRGVNLYFGIVMITTDLVELACFWALFGPYALGRKGPLLERSLPTDQ
jgi:hypothetical protein